MSVIAGMILGLGFSMIFPTFMLKMREKLINFVKSKECL